MNAAANQSPTEVVPALGKPLQVVLTFDQPSAARAARRMLNGFLQRWAADVDTHLDEWSFTEMEHPQCREEALDLARHCDIFVIALTGGDDLPVGFVEWLDEWVDSRAPIESALVLLVASNGVSPRLSCCDWLQAASRANNGLSFFTTTVPVEPPVALPSVHPKTLFARLSAINADLLPEVSGLNE